MFSTLFIKSVCFLCFATLISPRFSSSISSALTYWRIKGGAGLVGRMNWWVVAQIRNTYAEGGQIRDVEEIIQNDKNFQYIYIFTNQYLVYTEPFLHLH